MLCRLLILLLQSRLLPWHVRFIEQREVRHLVGRTLAATVRVHMGFQMIRLSSFYFIPGLTELLSVFNVLYGQYGTDLLVDHVDR